MSDDVFPVLPGLKWGVIKAPMWATKVLPASSGREERGTFQSYPRWKFILGYEFLRGGNGYAELQTLVGFFNQRLGSWDSFLYQDPNDYTVADQALGVGDGTTQEFRFVRALGGFVEPVLAPADTWVYLDRGGALGKWRLGGTSRSNAFGRSDDFSSSYWTKTGITVDTDAINAPDGTATADKLIEDSANSSHDLYRSLAPPGGVGAKHVISAYVRASGRTVCYLKSFWDGCGGAEFDLASHEVNFTDGGVLAAGIRTLSATWHRIWIVVRPTTADSHGQRLYLKAAAGGAVTYTGNGTSGMYATWPQCEEIPEDAPEEPTQYIASVGAGATTVAADFTLGDLGFFTFATAVPNAVEISWAGTFWFRCRFLQDVLEIEEFMRDLFQNKRLEFISVKDRL